MSKENKEIQLLIEQAADTPVPLHAMQFAQAALNAANALLVLVDIKRADES